MKTTSLSLARYTVITMAASLLLMTATISQAATSAAAKKIAGLPQASLVKLYQERLATAKKAQKNYQIVKVRCFKRKQENFCKMLSKYQTARDAKIAAFKQVKHEVLARKAKK